MNNTQAKAMLDDIDSRRKEEDAIRPIIEAFINGDEIQVSGDKGWETVTNPIFNLEPKSYRVLKDNSVTITRKDLHRAWDACPEDVCPSKYSSALPKICKQLGL